MADVCFWSAFFQLATQALSRLVQSDRYRIGRAPQNMPGVSSGQLLPMDELQEFLVRGPQSTQSDPYTVDVRIGVGSRSASRNRGFVGKPRLELASTPCGAPMAVDELPGNAVKPRQIARRVG